MDGYEIDERDLFGLYRGYCARKGVRSQLAIPWWHHMHTREVADDSFFFFLVNLGPTQRGDH